MVNNISSSDFFFVKPKSPDKEIDIYTDKLINIKKGSLTTIYGDSGVGKSYLCYYLLNKLENSLYINTDYTFIHRDTIFKKEFMYSCSSIIDEIVQVINQAIINKQADVIFIDDISSIVTATELNDPDLFNNMDNKYYSFPIKILLKIIKYYSERYGTTFIISSQKRRMRNETDNLLIDNSNLILNVSRHRNLYAYGDCIGYTINVNDNKYKLFFKDGIV